MTFTYPAQPSDPKPPLQEYADHARYIQAALLEARHAAEHGDVPIGAVLVQGKDVIARGHNRRITGGKPWLHAEIVCLQRALHDRSDLSNTILYTTHMPCHLCAGAIIQFGVPIVVCGNSQTFPHAKRVLQGNGVQVVDLGDVHCREILERFIGIHQAAWAGCSQRNRPIRLSDPPALNPYQYPLLWPVTGEEGRSFQRKLRLDESPEHNEPFSLFISVPYCRVKCRSCPFFKNLLPHARERAVQVGNYVAALVRQSAFVLSTPRFAKRYCPAIYIGGGTPSVLTAGLVQEVLGPLLDHPSVNDATEITLEGNPRDFTEDYLGAARFAGVNRISLGYQSANKGVLSSIGSPHADADSTRSLKAVVFAGFRTVNVDILYGVPGQTRRAFIRDVSRVLALGPDAITLYRYCILPGSAAARRMARRRAAMPPGDDEELAKWFMVAKSQCERSGYREYRFGNFAKPGHEQVYSKVSYASDAESIGVGAGAYGFISGYMYRTCNSPRLFSARVSGKHFVSADFVSRQASLSDRMVRYAIHNLFYGHLSLAAFRRHFGVRFRDAFGETVAVLEAGKLASLRSGVMHVTGRGRWKMDAIVRSFVTARYLSVEGQQDIRR